MTWKEVSHDVEVVGHDVDVFGHDETYRHCRLDRQSQVVGRGEKRIRTLFPDGI